MYLYNMDQYHYVELFLDSRVSTASVENQTNLDYPTFTMTNPLVNIAYLKVLEAEIPFSYYILQPGFNTFSLQETGQTRVTVTIPPGNYTSSSLADVLKTRLDAASLGGRVYTVEFNVVTQKFTISISSNTFVLLFNDNQKTLQNMLGMAQVHNATASITAPFTAQITGDNYVYLCSTKLAPSVMAQTPISKNVEITRIPITTNPGSVTFYTDPTPEKWFNVENLQNLQRFDLFLRLGSSTEILQLNGQNFSLKLGLLLYK